MYIDKLHNTHFIYSYISVIWFNITSFTDQPPIHSYDDSPPAYYDIYPHESVTPLEVLVPPPFPQSNDAFTIHIPLTTINTTTTTTTTTTTHSSNNNTERVADSRSVSPIPNDDSSDMVSKYNSLILYNNYGLLHVVHIHMNLDTLIL